MTAISRTDDNTLVLIIVVTLMAIRSNSFDGAAGSVYFGRSVSLNLWLLVLPVSVWVCGSALDGEARRRPANAMQSEPVSVAQTRQRPERAART